MLVNVKQIILNNSCLFIYVLHIFIHCYMNIWKFTLLWIISVNIFAPLQNWYLGLPPTMRILHCIYVWGSAYQTTRGYQKPARLNLTWSRNTSQNTGSVYREISKLKHPGNCWFSTKIFWRLTFSHEWFRIHLQRDFISLEINSPPWVWEHPSPKYWVGDCVLAFNNLVWYQ